MRYELNRMEKAITAALIAFFVLILAHFFDSYSSILLALYLFTGDRPRIFYAALVSFPRDARYLYRSYWANQTIMTWVKRSMTVGDILEETTQKNPNKTAFILDDDKITFRELNNFSNQVANYFHGKGYTKGDSIALIMETKLEFPAFYIGLSKIGVVTALINTNLRKESLVNSIKSGQCKAIIVSAELSAAVAGILYHWDIQNLPVYQYNTHRTALVPGAVNFRADLEKMSTEKQFTDTSISPLDMLVYIFTSGTTGLPKAAKITHTRFMFLTKLPLMFGLNEDDIAYVPLPLYHVSGGLAGVSLAVNQGLTVVLRKKFSASGFWPECIKYECTVAMYIGEMCRYVLSVPPRKEDREHKVRLVFGNGIKPQIWDKFVNRFGIQGICELYASTEGNSSLVNIDNISGSVGCLPILASPLPIEIIRCYSDGVPVRNKNGYCIRCKPGEAGVLVSKIKKDSLFSDFIGYSDQEATEQKIIRNAFKEDEDYFNSGDIFVMDMFNNFYFKDRVGDNYRWHGENVSTIEVEGVISNIVGLKDCAVYGVQVPHTEGRAGMVAIVDPDGNLNLEKLSARVVDELPPYARPLFVRVMPKVPLTGTHKLIKGGLVKEGFDIHKIKEPIFFFDTNGEYKRLLDDSYNDILKGNVKI